MHTSHPIPENCRTNFQNFCRVVKAEIESITLIALATNVATLALTVISSYAAFGTIGAVAFTAVALLLNFRNFPEAIQIYRFCEEFDNANLISTIFQVALSSIAGAFYFQGLWSIPCSIVSVLSLGMFVGINNE